MTSSATPSDPQPANPAAAQTANPAETPSEDLAVGVVDLHVDVPWQVNDKGRDPLLLEGHASAKTLLAGNYVGLTFPIYLSDKLHDGDGPRIEDAETMLATIQKIIRVAGVFVPPGKAAEEGKITAFISIEGAGGFATDITKIDAFIDRGVRLIGPVHQKDNRLSTSATGDDREKLGLTPLGKQFCDRVYSKGALIDVSHMSDKAFADLVPIAAKYGAPLIATHSNARAIADQSRNLTDAQLRKIAETGGVAGLNFHSHFVNGKPKSTLEDIVKQAEHMVKVAGIDHVAIGSDYDGGIRPPTGLEDAGKLPALAKALKKRGMTHTDVTKIFSLNALRVLGWRPATMVQSQIEAAKAADEERLREYNAKLNGPVSK